MKFRPCIDLREGRVTQIVGGSLTATAGGGDSAHVNFESALPAAHFAALYRERALTGGHVIMLGAGNEQAALDALGAYPGGMQVGGGVTAENARRYLDAGASHVIVTSYVFRDGAIDMQRLGALVAAVGRERLVLDLSCRKRARSSPAAATSASSANCSEADAAFEYVVVTDRWQQFTSLVVTAAALADLAQYCAEFLVHGVDVEGRRCGVEAPLVALLGAHSPIPVTYAGGVQSLADVELVRRLGGGRVDLTIGSALDVFGGSLPMDTVIAYLNAATAAEAVRAALPATMRAIELTAAGGPEVMRVAERPVPRVAAGEVLIRSAASGVNRPDILQRTGSYAPPPGASDIPGLEVAGTIVAFGGDPDSDPHGAQTAIAAAAVGLFLGSRVCALVAGGGYAEYCAAPLGQCLPSPAALSDAEAAALPETFFTVWSNVFERGRLRAGEWLLVHGGTSGIGATAIQLARAFGAHVVVTCGSADKCAQALALGATHAVCYRDNGGDWASACRALLPAGDASRSAGFDVILDMVAGAYVEREIELLAEDGRLVLIAVQGGVQAHFNAGLVLRKRLTITGSTLRARPVAFKSAIAAALRERVWPLWTAAATTTQAVGGTSESSEASSAAKAAPVLRANVDRTFRGADAGGAADAHRLMESGAFVGKIVLTWDQHQ